MSKRIHPIDALVGQRLQTLRIERGLSQTSLASCVGLTFQQVQKYEKGANRISASKLFQFATALGVEVAVFFKDLNSSDADLDPGRTEPSIAKGFDQKVAKDFAQIPEGEAKRKLRSLISTLSRS